MPRKPRKTSRNGIYHIMIRGINKQTIFEDDDDRLKFLQTLRKYKDISSYEIFAYCLMDNHVHLLLKENHESISKAIQRISSSYVLWYNHKYERNGHLFQERYKSENVETLPYFFKVLRYIHQNPMKAGMADNVFMCKWTSIDEYLSYPAIVNTDYCLELYSPDRNKALQLFRDYMQQNNDDVCLDGNEKVRLSDNELKDVMVKIGFPSTASLQKMDRRKRDSKLVELKTIEGVSIRQLSRVTGISKNIIARAR